eukprot:TRINITY_DN35186_c0_g1_i3.p1 TRINITY_DN35186_c0_g1~~TRINITY_DN35186_c0_g1_i3.p1  ORF type:complete len:1769 (+),score=383.89 TRINITY_DN35186_c0_g1_i3:478-5784(+)
MAAMDVQARQGRRRWSMRSAQLLVAYLMLQMWWRQTGGVGECEAAQKIEERRQEGEGGEAERRDGSGHASAFGRCGGCGAASADRRRSQSQRCGVEESGESKEGSPGDVGRLWGRRRRRHCAGPSQKDQGPAAGEGPAQAEGESDGGARGETRALAGGAGREAGCRRGDAKRDQGPEGRAGHTQGKDPRRPERSEQRSCSSSSGPSSGRSGGCDTDIRGRHQRVEELRPDGGARAAGGADAGTGDHGRGEACRAVETGRGDGHTGGTAATGGAGNRPCKHTGRRPEDCSAALQGAAQCRRGCTQASQSACPWRSNRGRRRPGGVARRGCQRRSSRGRDGRPAFFSRGRGPAGPAVTQGHVRSTEQSRDGLPRRPLGDREEGLGEAQLEERRDEDEGRSPQLTRQDVHEYRSGPEAGKPIAGVKVNIGWTKASTTPIKLMTNYDNIPDRKPISDMALELTDPLHVMVNEWQATEVEAQEGAGTEEAGGEVVGIHIYTDGSFIPEKDDQPDRAGWAMVVLAELGDGSKGTLGYMAGEISADKEAEDYYEKEALTILDAENIAVAAAMRYLLALKKPPKWACIHPDCKVTIDLTEGRIWATGTRYSGDVLTGLTAAVEEVMGLRCSHIRSHCGHPWNELADSAAKAAAKSQLNIPSVARLIKPPGSDQVAAAGEAQWEFLAYINKEELRQYPELVEGGMVLRLPTHKLPDEKLAETLKCEQIEKSWSRKNREGHQGPQSIQFDVASANVLTMAGEDDAARSAGSGMNVLGRGRMLMQQFNGAGVKVVGIQEARSSEAKYMTEHYLVASSAADKGNYGCQIWLAKKWPGFCIASKHLTVLVSRPRLIMVAVRSPNIAMDIASLHAPHSGAGADAIAEWWTETAELLMAQRQGNHPLYVLMDANADAHMAMPAMGSLHAAEPSEASTCMEQFLASMELALPSTRPEYQAEHERHTTWVHTSGSEKRLDYVAVPQDELASVQKTWVSEDLDLSTARRDHYAVVARIKLQRDEGRPKDKTRRAKVMEAEQLAQKAHELTRQLSQIQPIEWSTDPTAHAAILNQEVVAAAAAVAPIAQGKAKPCWMTTATKDMVAQKAKLMKANAKGARAVRKETLRAYLKAWRQRSWTRQLDHSTASKLAKLHYEEAARSVQVKALVTKIKRRVREEKAQEVVKIVDGVAEDLSEAKLREAFKGIKKLRPFKPDRHHLLKAADGSTATDHLQQREAWLEHWAKKFKGETMVAETLVKDYYVVADRLYDQLEDQEGWAIESCITDLPTRHDLEVMFTKAKTGKARGLDNIPPELLRVCAKPLARLFHPLVCKSILTWTAPLQWNGGLVHEIPKNQLKVGFAAHRPIFINSIPQKAMHGVLRKKVMAEIIGNLREGVYGGVPQKGTDMAIHNARAFQRVQKKKNRASAALFVDVVGAFDSIRRERLAAIPSEGLQGGSLERALTKLGVSPGLQRAVTATFAAPWMTVEGADRVCKTHLGTKAGDPLGDLLFLCEFAVALNRVHAALRRADILEVTELRAGSILQRSEDEPIAGATDEIDVSFIDDVVFTMSGKGPAEVYNKLTTALGIIVEEFAASNLEVNMAPGKTAAVFSFAGKDTVAWKKKLLIDQEAIIEVHTTQGLKNLPVVNSYAHLGCFYDVAASNAPEARKRAALAYSALQDLKPAFVKGTSLGPQQKVGITNRLVLSRLLYSVHTWSALGPKDYKALAAPYNKALRKSLGKDSPADRKKCPDADLMMAEGVGPLGAHQGEEAAVPVEGTEERPKRTQG